MSEDTVLVQGPVLTMVTWNSDPLVHCQNVPCCVAHIGDDTHAQFTNIIALQFTNILQNMEYQEYNALICNICEKEFAAIFMLYHPLAIPTTW